MSLYCPLGGSTLEDFDRDKGCQCRTGRDFQVHPVHR